ncbi:MAG TPA: SgcJ/EcaC family oxidoreductase [Nitrososphaera sp.]|nr:SgcJ/EcaC family oxidoreductase [Nitrososphaera sp.]
MNHNSQTMSSAAADESAIRSLYQQLMDGWNAASGRAFASPFEEDADLVGFDGTSIKGRHEIALFHQCLFDMFLKGSRLVGKVRSVRFATPDVAVMHTVGGTVMAGQTDLDPERNSIQTLVAVKRNGKWSLAAFQNTRAIYIGRTEESQKLTEELRSLL